MSKSNFGQWERVYRVDTWPNCSLLLLILDDCQLYRGMCSHVAAHYKQNYNLVFAPYPAVGCHRFVGCKNELAQMFSLLLKCTCDYTNVQNRCAICKSWNAQRLYNLVIFFVWKSFTYSYWRHYQPISSHLSSIEEENNLGHISVQH